ncbi:DUF6153 family protein [Streptomyces sp. AD55]|uniref:DUF6153 family protein n=1 Tax=Streptomyces sp. AD55 TaxID=3242895 RepID=UPI0035296A2E
MLSVSTPEPSVRRPPVWWWRAACLLGVLAGVLGMHGLAPGGGLPPEHPAPYAAAPRHAPGSAVPASVVPETVHACAAEDGPGGGRLRHADATCASGALAAGPALPALVPDPVAAPARHGAAHSRTAGAPDAARAPPSLAELQLLRI